MKEIKIPHAERTFLDRDPPRTILHVVANLPQNSWSQGFSAEAKQEMLKAVAAQVFQNELDDYQIHWSDTANATRT